MIVCSGETVDFLPERLRKAIEDFWKKYLPTLAVGQYPLGDDYFILMENDTVLEPEAKYEVHRKYTDIQLVLDGEELHCYTVDSEATELENKMEDSDVAFYESATVPTRIYLRPGLICVYYPGELHMPGCNTSGATRKVRKAVIKVKEEDLWSLTATDT